MTAIYIIIAFIVVFSSKVQDSIQQNKFVIAVINNGNPNKNLEALAFLMEILAFIS